MIKVERVDAKLEDHVRVVKDAHVRVPEVGDGGSRLEFRKGWIDGDLDVYLHGPDGVCRMAKVRLSDVRTALDLVEVEDA